MNEGGVIIGFKRCFKFVSEYKFESSNVFHNLNSLIICASRKSGLQTTSFIVVSAPLRRR